MNASGAVRALAVYDDGNGPSLHAGGSFSSAGGVLANRVARWDGSTWSALGVGLNSDVLALTVYDDVPPSGSFFPQGTTIVVCTATDAWGNQSTCQFTVDVEPKVRQAPR